MLAEKASTPDFQLGQQNDAQEALGHLQQLLLDDMLTTKENLQFLPFQPVGLLYNTTCQKCRSSTKKKDDLAFIKIDFPAKYQPKINGAKIILESGYETLDNLIALSQPEELVQIACVSKNCRGSQSPSKRTQTLVDLPLTLVFLFNRFAADPRSKNQSFVRMRAHVFYPEQLQIEGKLYDLYGVIHHQGATTKCGHYTSDVRMVDLTTGNSSLD